MPVNSSHRAKHITLREAGRAALPADVRAVSLAVCTRSKQRALHHLPVPCRAARQPVGPSPSQCGQAAAACRSPGMADGDIGCWGAWRRSVPFLSIRAAPPFCVASMASLCPVCARRPHYVCTT